jgi:hypothetical protein
MPVPIICDLEEHKFSGSEGVHSLPNASTWGLMNRSGSDPTESVTVATSAQKKLRQSVLMLNEWLIS